MFTIGDFAQYGRVSARMLRHYDAIGLLRPARTDPVTGYRFYEAAQLARLNRIIALKDLGFSLQQVGAILAEEVSVPELRGMLRLRQAELSAALTAAGARLAQVEARLRTIESEGRMSADDVVVKPTGTVLLAELSGTAMRLRPRGHRPGDHAALRRAVPTAGDGRGDPRGTGPGVLRGRTGAGRGSGRPAEERDGRDAIVVHAGMVITEEALAKAGATPAAAAGATTGGASGLGFNVVTLPGLAAAATVVHHGPMSRILPTAQNLAHWIDDNGYRSAGYARELYLECPPDQEKWVTEIQEPVVRA